MARKAAARGIFLKPIGVGPGLPDGRVGGGGPAATIASSQLQNFFQGPAALGGQLRHTPVSGPRPSFPRPPLGGPLIAGGACLWSATPATTPGGKVSDPQGPIFPLRLRPGPERRQTACLEPPGPWPWWDAPGNPYALRAAEALLYVVDRYHGRIQKIRPERAAFQEQASPSRHGTLAGLLWTASPLDLTSTMSPGSATAATNQGS